LEIWANYAGIAAEAEYGIGTDFELIAYKMEFSAVCGVTRPVRGPLLAVVYAACRFFFSARADWKSKASTIPRTSEKKRKSLSM
jgi:hypothetical protein